MNRAVERPAAAHSPAVVRSIPREIFHPVGRRLVAQVDAVLRIGGPSIGADEMVSLARSHRQAGLSLH